MIKLLVVNGCSLTRGQELDSPETDAWPAIVSAHLGLRMVSLARDGGSNRRVVRITVSRMHSICREHDVAPGEVLVLILWTGIDRAEYLARPPDHPPDGRAGPHRRSSPATIRAIEWELIGPWLKTRRNRAVQPDGRVARRAAARVAGAFYEHLWSPEAQQANFIVDWAMLDGFLTSCGFHARYAFGYPEMPGWFDHDAGLSDLIDRSRVFGRCDGRRENSFIGLTWDMPRGPLFHPLADGHRLFGQTLASWLQRDHQTMAAAELTPPNNPT